MLLQLNKNLRCIKEHIAKNKTNVVGAGPVSAHQTKDKNILKTEGVTMINNLKNKRKINIKILLGMLIMLIGLIIMPNSVKAAVDVDSLTWGTETSYTDTYATYKYKPDSTNTYAWITLCTPTGTEVVFPSTINTLTVVSLGDAGYGNIFGTDVPNSYNEDVTRITLPNELVEIRTEAFGCCKGLTGNLIIPESVTYIGNAAFYECSGLTGDLVIPKNVKTIGQYAFSGCDFAGNSEISANLANMYSGMFYGCTFSSSLKLNNIEGMTGEVFDGCILSGSLIIGENVTSIGDNAFKDCSNFTGNLVISDSVTSIGNYAFSNCGFTGKLIMPDSITNIGTSAFSGCSGFTGELIIPESVTYIGGGAFSNCSGFTGDLIIPDSVTGIINYSTFENCSGFSGDLVIGNGITVIRDYAFYECSGLRGNLIIGNSVTSIGLFSFDGCTSLEKAILPSVTQVEMINASSESFGSVPVYAETRSMANAYNAYSNWSSANNGDGVYALQEDPTIDDAKALTTIWKIPAGENGEKVEITLPLTGTNIEFIVDWGDGNIETVTKAFETHEYNYETATDTTIKVQYVAGTDIDWGYSASSSVTSGTYYTYTQYLTEVTNWGEIGAIEYGFAFCKKLEKIPDSAAINSFVNLKKLSYMFYNCTELKKLDLSYMDTSNVTTMLNMCRGCSKLEIVDMSSFDTTKTTNIKYMFTSASKLKTLIISNKFFVNQTNLDGFGAPQKMVVVSKTPSGDQFANAVSTFNLRTFYVPNESLKAYREAWASIDSTKILPIYDFPGGTDYLHESGEEYVEPSYTILGVSEENLGNYLPEKYVAKKEGSVTKETLGDYTVTHTLLNSGDEITKVKINTRVADPKTIFKTEWTLPSGDTIKLPLRGTDIDFIVDWGDGKSERVTDGWKTHEYKNTAEEIFEIKVSYVGGTSIAWGYNSYTEPTSSNYETYTKYLTKLTNWGEINATKYGFAHCSNLVEVSGDATTNTFKNMNTAAFMFYNCISLTTLNLDNVDTSGVESMESMFRACTSLTSLDLRNLDTSKVTKMFAMFYECRNITELDLSNFNTAKVTSMGSMFTRCHNLEKIDLSSFDTSSVTNMQNMLSEFLKPRNILLSNKFIVSENNTNMFIGNASIKLITISETPVKDQFKGIITGYMNLYVPNQSLDSYISTLSGDTAKEKIKPIISFYSGDAVLLEIGEDYVEREYKIADYTEDKLIALGSGDKKLYGFDIVINETVNEDLVGDYPIKYTLNIVRESEDKKLTTKVAEEEILVRVADPKTIFKTEWTLPSGDTITLPLRGSSIDFIVDWGDGKSERVTENWKTHEYANTEEETFEIKVSYVAGTDISWGSSYYGDVEEVSKESGDYTYTKYLTKLTNWGEINAKNYTFAYCKNLTYVSGDKTDNTFNNLISTQFMFFNCKNLETLNVSNIDTSKVTTMWSMFYWCQKVTNLDVSNFDTSNVTNMGNMFYYCRSLKSLDVSNFNTSNVISMSAIFTGCDSLTTIDLSNFDTTNVTDMAWMFYHCSSLESIKFDSGFNTSKAINMSGMFRYCKNLISLDLSSFNTSKANNMAYMFQNTRALKSVLVSNKFIVSGDITDMLDGTNSALKFITISETPVANQFKGIISGDMNLYVPNAKLSYYISTLSGDTNKENIKPIISLENSAILLEVGEDYVEQEYKIADYTEAELEALGSGDKKLYGFNIIIDGTVNKNSAADYPITYTLNIVKQSGDKTIQAKVAEEEILVRVADPKTIFKTEWTLPSGDTITLPLRGSSIDFIVDWGDGKSERVTENWKTHEYANTEEETFEIKVSYIAGTNILWGSDSHGDTNHEVPEESTDYTYTKYLTRLTNWGEINARRYGFAYCENLTYVSGDRTTKTFDYFTDMFYMFAFCKNLTTLNVSNIDTSNVTDMQCAFLYCESLEKLDISNFDTFKVLYMIQTFSNLSLKTLDLSSLNTSNVINMWGMFLGSNQLKTLDLSNFNTSNVTSMGHMFSNTKLTNIDISSFNTSNVKNMQYMFRDTSLLESILISNKFIISGDTTDMLTGTNSNLKFITISEDPVENQFRDIITGDMRLYVPNESLERYITALAGNTYKGRIKPILSLTLGDENIIYASEFVDNENPLVAEFSKDASGDYIFGYKVKASGEIDTKKLEEQKITYSLTRTFNSGDESVTVPVTKVERIIIVNGINDKLALITKWEIPSGENVKINLPLSGDGIDFIVDWGDGKTERIDEGYKKHLYNFTEDTEVTIKVQYVAGTEIDWGYNGGSAVTSDSDLYTYTKYLTKLTNWGEINARRYGFAYCEKLEYVSGDVTDNTFKYMTSALYMFGYCKNLQTLNTSNIDTSNVIDMYGMFSYCNSLTILDLNKFNTQKVRTMSAMFYNCGNLEKIYLSNFNTSTVKNMSYMFESCSKLNNLDISNFDTSKVTNMYGMFSNCSSLTNLDIGNFDTSNVINMYIMFSNCSLLTNLDLSNFDTSKVINMYAMFNNCTNLKYLDISNFDTSSIEKTSDAASGMKDFLKNNKALESVLISNKFIISGDSLGILNNANSTLKFITISDEPVENQFKGRISGDMKLYVPNGSIQNYRTILNGDTQLENIKPILESTDGYDVKVIKGEEYNINSVTVAGFGIEDEESYKVYGYELEISGDVDTNKGGQYKLQYILKRTY